MVAIKIVCTFLGLCVACSRTAPSNPTLISSLLSQPEEKGVKIPVRSYDVSSRRLHEETISRLLKRLVLKEQLKTKKVKDDKGASQIVTPEAKSEDTTVQVSPNVHSDYLHIENYIPTFITIPCASSSCDPQSPARENGHTSDNTQSNIPPTNSIHLEHAPSYDVADYFYVISETPTLIPLYPVNTDHSLPSTNSDIISSLHTSDDSLTDTEFSEILQSEIYNIPVTESKHIIVASEQPLLPSSHPEFHATYYDTVNDAIEKDVYDSEYNKFSEFTSYPHHSMTVNDEILTHGNDTNLPPNPPSSFDSTVVLPEPPAYFPLKPSFIEAIDHTEDDDIISLSDTYKPLQTTDSENSTLVFENRPLFVIPEAPVLFPLYSSNITHSSLENISSYNLIENMNDLDIFNSENSSKGEKKIDTTNASHIQTNPSLSPASPTEPILIPEPPIYFPLNPPNANAEQSETEEAVSLLDNYEASYSFTMPEKTPPSIVSLPTVLIPEVSQLMPINPPNITFDSSTENPKTQETTHLIDHAHLITLDDSPNLLNIQYINEQNDKAVDTTESSTSSSNFETISLQNDLIQIPEASKLNTSNPLQYSIVSLDNSLYNQKDNEVTYYNKENKGWSVDSIKIPEAPQLLPLNPPNIIFSSPTENSMAQESTPVIYSDYLDSFHPEIITESDDLVERPYVVIPPSPALMPLHPPSENINSVIDGNKLINFNSRNQNYISNTHTIDHAHSITLDDSPNLLNLHYINEQNDKSLETTESYISSSNYEATSSQNDLIQIPEAPELNPLQSSIVSLDSSLYNQNTNDEVTYYDNENKGGSVDSIKIPEAPQRRVNSYLTHEDSESNPENSPLNILLSTNQKITLPHILQNSNVIVVSNNHNEVRGQKEHFISSSPKYSSSRYEESEPFSIVQDSNIVVSSSPIIVEKTNEIVSQLNSTMQNLKLHNEGIQTERRFINLPPCESDKPVDGGMTHAFEPKKCKQEVEHLKTNSSFKQSNTKRSRRRKVVIKRRKAKVTNVTKN